MKKGLVLTFYGIAFLSILLFKDNIINFFVERYVYKSEQIEYRTNEYSSGNNYDYVKIDDSFNIKNKEELINSLYTILDSGLDEYIFYCDDSYPECQNDIETISNDQKTLSSLNNFVHPYNSYDKLFITTNNIGKVKIKVSKLYSESEIEYINDTLKEIESKILNNEMTDEEKIKAFHDYIINNTEYDGKRADEIKNNTYSSNIYNSHKATGVLLNHVALCSGYTDIMSIFLYRLGLKNIKVSNTDHVWNAVYLNNKWLHLDLTWDDPVTTSGNSMLIEDYFLIDTKKLNSKMTVEHYFDNSVYKELKASYN